MMSGVWCVNDCYISETERVRLYLFCLMVANEQGQATGGALTSKPISFSTQVCEIGRSDLVSAAEESSRTRITSYSLSPQTGISFQFSNTGTLETPLWVFFLRCRRGENTIQHVFN